MSSEGTSAETTAAGQIAGKLTIKKGLVYDMLPGSLSVGERFKMARNVGFEVVQANTTPDEHAAEEIKKAAEAAGIRIDSVMNMDHWKYPLSSGDAAVVEKSLFGGERLDVTYTAPGGTPDEMADQVISTLAEDGGVRPRMSEWAP